MNKSTHLINVKIYSWEISRFVYEIKTEIIIGNGPDFGCTVWSVRFAPLKCERRGFESPEFI